MATAAIIKPYINRCVSRIRHYPEAASQTFVVGDVLILATASDKGNECKIASADPVVGIIGIAAEAASGTEGTSIGIYDGQGNTFIANIDGTTALDADMTGLSCGLVVTSGAVRVDTTDTSNKSVRITQLIDAVGTVSGKVEFVFLNSVLAVGQ